MEWYHSWERGRSMWCHGVSESDSFPPPASRLTKSGDTAAAAARGGSHEDEDEWVGRYLSPSEASRNRYRCRLLSEDPRWQSRHRFQNQVHLEQHQQQLRHCSLGLRVDVQRQPWPLREENAYVSGALVGVLVAIGDLLEIVEDDEILGGGGGVESLLVQSESDGAAGAVYRIDSFIHYWR